MAKGFDPDALVDAGLALRGPNRSDLVDAYRNRVLVAVRDDSDRVIGLIGRTLGTGNHPKYINPPATAVYDKSVCLYRPLPAPSDSDGHVLVVEGTFDALAVASAAIRLALNTRVCPITQSGRELSGRQIDNIAKVHPNAAILMFDDDTAGQDSTTRYFRAFASRGHRAVPVALPEGHDPASLLAGHGWRGLVELLRGGRHSSSPGPGSEPLSSIPELAP